ncbi:MAG: DUF2252 domain-containing protein [Clostridia bacterium]|nr:DUF2252 domain-containing protein [Clostridia bacterium]
MFNYSADLIRDTRCLLRKQTLEKVLEQFDGKLMDLTYEERKEKYKKMAESCFRFYRGSAYLFYYDVTRMPFIYHTPQDCPTWIQGDLHFENFGTFQNEDGHLVYDVNDFDEGYVGSYLYDILRMIVSIVLFSETQGLEKDVQEEIIDAYLEAYYKQIKKFVRGEENPFTLEYTVENTKGPVNKLLKKLSEKQAEHFLEGVTSLTQESRRFTWTEEIHPASPEERKWFEDVWKNYLESLESCARKDECFYKIKDIAVKHGSGTASIGLDRYYVLVEGGRESQALDDLVLEVKEVRAPVPAYFLPYHERFWKKCTHQGQRVTLTQKAMHHKADPFLGYVTMDGRHFYVRERSPFKKRLKAKNLLELKDMVSAVKVMGKVTAKIHARADADADNGIVDYHSEGQILKAMGDVSEFCRHLRCWAFNYAGQVHEDYHLFCQWVKDHFNA